MVAGLVSVNEQIWRALLVLANLIEISRCSSQAHIFYIFFSDLVVNTICFLRLINCLMAGYLWEISTCVEYRDGNW